MAAAPRGYGNHARSAQSHRVPAAANACACEYLNEWDEFRHGRFFEPAPQAPRKPAASVAIERSTVRETLPADYGTVPERFCLRSAPDGIRRRAKASGGRA